MITLATENSKLSKYLCYPVVDIQYIKVGQRHNTYAVWTGEKRYPKKGEWYLSGSVIEACRAPNDLSNMEFHIAKLVRVLTKTVNMVKIINDN